MKVLKVPGDGWTKKTTCGKCKTHVELVLADLRYVNDQRDGDAVVWRCPTCQREIWSNTTFVPKHLHNRLRRS